MTNFEKAQNERERAFYLYTNAVERGDFETLGNILAQAERDVLLEAMILELNEQFQIEEGSNQFEQDAKLVNNLVSHHFTRNEVEQLDQTELEQLTVQDVLYRMKTEPQILRQFGKELEMLIWQLRHKKVSLPDQLDRLAISRLFTELKVKPSPFFLKAFRETAIFLQMGREEQEAQLAAARKKPRSIRQKGDSKNGEPAADE